MRLSTGSVCAVIVLGLMVFSSSCEAAYDPGWGVPQLLETQNAGDVTCVQVAMDPDGNAIAAWCQYDGLRQNVMSSRYVVGVGWGVAELIEDNNAGSAFEPRLAADGHGNVIVVWRQDDGVQLSIWSNRYVAGVGWGEAEPIENDDLNNAVGPEVAADMNGNAIAVWSHHDGDRYNVYANRYTVAGGWGMASAIETHSLGDASSPQIAMTSEGDSTVVWSQYDSVTWSVAANRFDADSGWGSAQVIESIDGMVGGQEVAVDGEGNVFAVWIQFDGARYNLWSNRFVVGDGWGAAELVEADDSGDALNPQAAADGDGNAVVVWSHHDGTRYNIMSNRYVAGDGWGTAEMIEADDRGHAQYPQVDMDDGGNAVAVWYQNDGTRTNIMSNRYTAGEGWGDAELIESDNSGGAFEPNVAVDGEGNAVAVWYQYDGLWYSAWASRYVIPDTSAPSLTLSSPSEDVTVGTPTVEVSGTTEPGVSLVINGVDVALEANGSFSFVLALVGGSNDIAATATDEAGNSVTVTRTVTYEDPAVALEEDLAALQEELDGVSSDLADATEELDSVSGDLAGLRSQNLVLIAVMVVLAVLVGVMTFMYMGLRKQVKGTEGGPGNAADKT